MNENGKKIKYCTTYRTIQSLKKRIDAMVKKYGRRSIVIDHGVAGYEYSRYEIIEGNYKNNYEPEINIYVYDFMKKDYPEILYMNIKEYQLQKPSKKNWGLELVHCSWDKRFPKLLYIREYNNLT